MSMYASRTLKQVAEAAPDSLKFFAMYPLKDTSVVLKLVRQAEEHGFKAIAVTMDHPVHFQRANVHMPTVLDDTNP